MNIYPTEKGPTSPDLSEARSKKQEEEEEKENDISFLLFLKRFLISGESLELNRKVPEVIYRCV